MSGTFYQYGSYTYPQSTILNAPKEVVGKQRVADTPGRVGKYSQGALLDAQRRVLTGQLILNPGDDLDTFADAFWAAHAPGQAQQLFLGRDDRYLNAEVSGTKEVNPQQYPTSLSWEVDFFASDPYFYSTTVNTLSLGTGGTTTVTTGGTAPSTPIAIKVIVASGGGVSGDFVTISNTTTLQSSTVSASATVAIPGTFYIIPLLSLVGDSETGSDGIDYTYLFSGSFWDLVSGANSINVATSDDVTLTSVEIIWQDRYY